MNYCKEMLGQDVYLVIYNENYGDRICKCCGQKIENNEWEWIYKEGYFSKIEIEGDDILYFATWTDDEDKDHEEVINRRWIGDVIEWKKALWNEDPTDFDIECKRYVEDISIFDLVYSTIEDSNCGAFATKEECLSWLEEFGKGD